MAIRSQSKADKKSGTPKWKIALAILCAVALVVLIAFGPRFAKQGIETLAERTRSWTCTEIRVVSGKELSADSLLRIAGITANASLIGYSPASIESKLMCNPWIRSVEVTRHPPNVLDIRVVERTGIALLGDGSNLAVSDDVVLLPAIGKPWAIALPWLSCNSQFARTVGKMSENDPLLPIAKQFARVSLVAPELARNMAEMYRVDGQFGAVLINPVLSVTISPDVSALNWMALAALLRDGSLQSKLDSNAVIDLRLPGFVTLHLPEFQAEES